MKHCKEWDKFKEIKKSGGQNSERQMRREEHLDIVERRGLKWNQVEAEFQGVENVIQHPGGKHGVIKATQEEIEESEKNRRKLKSKDPRYTWELNPSSRNLTEATHYTCRTHVTGINFQSQS
ncbi:hypothetical protein PIB30_094555 [Stylosanthes scabra]|uniref:Uncharacterized protein n=1 Tax=Stylosanthes scabra TaxID=79078 RepID=A0ABU6WVC4_9FABA|nr:hypothetical protein [Stylosanthes scabra]